MNEQPLLADDNTSFHVDEIKEVLNRRSGKNRMKYSVVPKEAHTESSESWLPTPVPKGGIASLAELGGIASTSTISSIPQNKDQRNKVKKRKRLGKGNSQKTSSLQQSDDDSNGSNLSESKSINAKATHGSMTIDGTVMLENALEKVGALRIREAFLERLDAIPGPKVSLVNDIDDTSPSLSFRFIDACILDQGVAKASDESMYGCDCKPNNGRHMGCEYTACECLDQMNVRKFPYIATGDRAGTLRDGHLRTRDAIFECNRLCSCGDDCKNKLVQWGRKVPLEIFKTSDRGWGLRCPVDLRRGEFVDIYKGEIITNREANERERAKRKTKAKDTYLYTMEKFAEDNNIPPHMLYVVDGEYYGGPTRFMNHSCDPNCRQFTVSYHHGDMYIYDLAFFAVDFIPAGTELTFNYTDNEYTEKKKKGKSRDAPECLCGSANCRGYIWM